MTDVRIDMDVNIGKCSLISFTRNANVFKYDYTVDNQKLKRVNEVKDLGIIIDSKLTFNQHVNYIFRRCNKLLGFIFRACKRFKSRKSVMFLYSSLIRWICEYVALIWNPDYKVYIDKIERSQRKFTKLVYYKLGIRKPDYEARLLYLRIQKLSLRRTIIDEMYHFKIINGFLDFDLMDKINFYTNQHGTRHGLLFDLPFDLRHRNSNIRLKWAAYRLGFSKYYFFYTQMYT